MAWYWYIIIGIAVVGFIILKVKMSSAFMRKQKEKKQRREKLAEEE